MATSKQPQTREPTRKRRALKRRDDERNRWLLIGLGIVAGILLLIIAVGVIQELVIKPRQPIATVNGVNIASSDYGKRVRFAWYQEANNPDSSQQTDPQSISLEVLDQMIDEELLREQAKQQGITVSPDEIEEALERSYGYQRNTPTPSPTPKVSPTPRPTTTPGGPATATPLPTPTAVSLTAYQSALSDYVSRLKTAADMSEADLKSLVEIDLLRNKLYEDVTKNIATTEEQVHARHILVRVQEALPTSTPAPAGQPTPTPNPNASPTPVPRDDAQALARIIAVQQKLGGGGDFAQLAKEYSDDPGSAEQGGDLGWFGRGRMVPEFEEGTFKLDPGQTSGPIKTSYGYHLVQVLERDSAREMDEYTAQQRKFDAFSQWLNDLRINAQTTRNWTLDRVPPTPGAQTR